MKDLITLLSKERLSDFNETFKEKREKPTKETLHALKTATSLPQYTSHEQLTQELQKEIQAEH